MRKRFNKNFSFNLGLKSVNRQMRKLNDIPECADTLDATDEALDLFPLSVESVLSNCSLDPFASLKKQLKIE